MSRESDLRLMAAELDEGENRYDYCPACGKEGKLSMMLENGRVVYHCFSASCSLHGGGAFNVNGSRLVHTRQDRRKKKVRPFKGELEHLSAEWKDYLARKYGFVDYHFMTARMMYAPEEHRVAYPIFSPMGRRRGWSLRSYSGEEPKALTRMDEEEPAMSWYESYPESGTVVVVEDQPSAIRVSRYLNAVALLGTGCGPDYVAELAAHARNVIWALDADATEQAVKLQRKYALMFNTSRVLVLEKDFKDTEESKLCYLLKMD